MCIRDRSLPGRIRSRAKALWEKLKFSFIRIRDKLKGMQAFAQDKMCIRDRDYTQGNMCLKYNRALAAESMDYFNKMAEEFSIQNDVKVSTLAKFPEVFSMEQAPDDEEHLWGILSAALEDAAVRFVQSREVEGEHLKNDLLGKLDYMTGLVDYIEGRSPQILTEYRAKLEAKVQELLNGTAMDEGRIAAEVTIYADKICVDEETVRPVSYTHLIRI